MEYEIDDDAEVFRIDGIGTKKDDDDAETTGGVENQGRRRGAGKRLSSATISRKAADDESTGGLESMGISALVASYAAYAAAHAMLVEERSRDGSMLEKLAAARSALQKQCMDTLIDVLFPLLAHVNPYVHVTAAIDILFSAFKMQHRAVEVLKIARGEGRGFCSFAAGFALDSYFHAKIAPLPDAILREATQLYTGLPHAITAFNGKAAADLPSPGKVSFQDGNPHTGRFISFGDQGSSAEYYAQHVGMNEYHVYRADRLTEIPKDGEQYHVGRNGALRRIPEGKARGKI